MPVAESLDFRIPSDVQCIEDVVSQVVQRCKALAFSRRHVSLNVPVALTEALSNAILRGNGGNGGNGGAAAHDVSLRIEIDDVRLVAEVRDGGSGFDLDGCTSDATLPENVLREDGRGLFLMRQLMDQVEQYSDHGNVVRLVLIRA